MKIKPSLIPFIKSFGLAVVSIFAICVSNNTKLSAAGCCPLAISFPRTGPGWIECASVHTRVPLGPNLKTKSPKKVYFKCMQNPPRTRFLAYSPRSSISHYLSFHPSNNSGFLTFRRSIASPLENNKQTNKKTHELRLCVCVTSCVWC